MKYGLLGLLLLVPLVSLAATTGSLQGLIVGTLGFINSILIPFVLGIAFLIFVINAIRFFVIGGSTDEGRENAKSLALYSIGAFVFILAFWGLINLIANGIGLVETPCIAGETLESDYIRSLAPCTSPRPVARPADPYIPIGGPGTFPVGSNGNPLPVGGPGTFPVGSNPIPKTIPPGGPGTFPVGDYTPIRAFADDVRTQVNSYINTTLPRYLGTNSSAVVSAMFADLSGAHQTGVTDYNRTVAMLRLENAGVLTAGTASQYATLLNVFYQNTGQIALNFNQATLESNTSYSLPIAVTTNRNATRQGIIDGLTLYNIQAPNPLTPAEGNAIIATLYTTNTSPEARFELFTNYYINVNFDPNNTLFDRYRNDLNAEIILQRPNQNRYTLLETIPH